MMKNKNEIDAAVLVVERNPRVHPAGDLARKKLWSTIAYFRSSREFFVQLKREENVIVMHANLNVKLGKNIS